MDEELCFSGLSISPRVFETLVTKAAQGVEGVAFVGVPTSTNALFQFLSGEAGQSQAPAVGVRSDGERVQVAVRVTAFFGYPFVDLADRIRAAVAEQVLTLTGIEVASVDVFIDEIVFPKE
ncbi:MAG: Asp23/Gls24 family envelope stress response protein [Coriobacteriales bacterium]|jgi:uncharacterized alkaline shock family protein YloU